MTVDNRSFSVGISLTSEKKFVVYNGINQLDDDFETCVNKKIGHFKVNADSNTENRTTRFTFHNDIFLSQFAQKLIQLHTDLGQKRFMIHKSEQKSVVFWSKLTMFKMFNIFREKHKKSEYKK